MKTSIAILIILLSFKAIGQDDKASNLQMYWFQEAENDLDSLQIKGAFSAYQISYEMLPNSELGKKAKKLSDSLRIILRKKFIQDLTGTWKLKIFGRIKSEDDKNHYERLGKFMIARDDSIFFYRSKASLRLDKPSSNQPIEFCDLATMFPHYSDIVHSNWEIWEYNIDSTKEKLTINENGKLSSDRKSRSWVVSHPSGYSYYRIK
jgi:hypothetical protein